MPGISVEDFSSLKISFADLKPLDKYAIGKLFDLLKNMEISSCVLRFLDPHNYGIMSSPVENLLNIKGNNQIEKYMNYLQNLDELKEEYKFERIADVDMALWALANIINYSELRYDSVYSDFYASYEQTTNLVKKIMARNSLEQIKEEKPLYKAELFLESDFLLAGIIAGRELDIFIKYLAKKNDVKLIVRTKHRDYRYLSIPELSNKLYSKRRITQGENDIILKWWDFRCDLLHKEKIKITKENVSEMIKWIGKFVDKYQM
jgi:hypothetical protein